MKQLSRQGHLCAHRGSNRLLTGPAGSGKSRTILGLFRDTQTLLIVPTISFREHTRNSLLRMAASSAPLLAGRSVATFEELAAPQPAFSQTRRELLVRRLLSRANVPYFRDVLEYPG